MNYLGAGYIRDTKNLTTLQWALNLGLASIAKRTFFSSYYELRILNVMLVLETRSKKAKHLFFAWPNNKEQYGLNHAFTIFYNKN